MWDTFLLVCVRIYNFRLIDISYLLLTGKNNEVTMRGLGTIINALAIIAGGLIGIFAKRFLKERYQETIMKASGFAVIFLGAAGTLSKMLVVTDTDTGRLSTNGTMLMIFSLTNINFF